MRFVIVQLQCICFMAVNSFLMNEGHLLFQCKLWCFNGLFSFIHVIMYMYLCNGWVICQVRILWRHKIGWTSIKHQLIKLLTCYVQRINFCCQGLWQQTIKIMVLGHSCGWWQITWKRDLCMITFSLLPWMSNPCLSWLCQLLVDLLTSTLRLLAHRENPLLHIVI